MIFKKNYRHDPLYRVIEITEETRSVEGKFKRQFDRLKYINNLGLISEVLETAKYPKYEHHIGTVYQVKRLLDCADEFEEKYKIPLTFSALFLHLGHLPFTYSTERSLLLARFFDNSKRIKDYVEERISNALKESGLPKEKREEYTDKLYSLENYRALYRYFSAGILLNGWAFLERESGLKKADKKAIILNLIDDSNTGYKYLNLADEADFIQRDGLYLGTVRLDVSPEHLYAQPLKDQHDGTVSSKEVYLLETNLEYLTHIFYDSNEVRWFTALYEKIMANIILSSSFVLHYLEEYNDIEFTTLITNNRDKYLKTAKLPRKWIDRAKDLFEGQVKYIHVFSLIAVPFDKAKNVLEIENYLIGRNIISRQLLEYPFVKGVLIDVDYSKGRGFKKHPMYESYTIRVFQNDKEPDFLTLLYIIRGLVKRCSLSEADGIRIGLSRMFSWTDSIRLNNKPLLWALKKGIDNLEEDTRYNKGGFTKKVLKVLTGYNTYKTYWDDFDRIAIVYTIDHIISKYRKNIDTATSLFTEILISLPTSIFGLNKPSILLTELHNSILKLFPEEQDKGDRGMLFEAICWLYLILKKNRKYQFLIQGMIVNDPGKNKKNRTLMNSI